MHRNNGEEPYCIAENVSNGAISNKCFNLSYSGISSKIILKLKT